jgi:endoglucanase
MSVLGGCVPKGKGVGSSGDAASAGPTADISRLLPNNLLKNTNFDDGTSLPWTSSFTSPGEGEAMVKDGAYCLEIRNVGTNPWDAQVRHREMTIVKGHNYEVAFKVWATKDTKLRSKIGQAGPPYSEYWNETVEVTTQPKQVTGKFTMFEADDATAEFAFHMGGNMATGGAPLTVCLDDVVLSDPQFTPQGKQEAAKTPDIAVNQVGYLPNVQKIATLKSQSTTPEKWELVDPGGKTIATGETKVVGMDQPSGDHVHLIDFSTVTTPGKGYTLKAGTASSYPFDIDKDIYRAMKYDALAYFYHNRSGIAIEASYAGDQKWARPAGHLHDNKVPCFPNTGCNYTLDVSGGWYDAGDHGKYVVNSGISVWTLLNLYERTKFLGTSVNELGDGKLKIPESRNGVPDVLDEARWNIEFMLKMQVPDGQPKAGMVHHKIHDQEWTALGLAPHQDKMKRFLHAPSTAATLNLAAVGAHCARVWKTIDQAFAGKCQIAAEKAWNAAQANPSVFAKADNNKGGGPYDDDKVTDDFYWAAAELFITTGKANYKDFITKSPHHATVPTDTAGGSSSMNWARTDTLGKISLAVVPNQFGDVAPVRKQIQDAADAYLQIVNENGYRVPFKGAEGKYPWGSNSFVLNNMIVMALAFDFTKDAKYLNGVHAGMDYLLGRNAMGQSYVTGYGDNPLRFPHHRFWSNQADPKFPTAPPGAVSGGPNSDIQDPYAKAAGLKGCAAQKCFVDNIEAWSVNEITINWNSPFAWVAAFLDEKSDAKVAPPKPEPAAKGDKKKAAGADKKAGSGGKPKR